MRSVAKTIQDFHRDDSGQAVTEYILILSLSVGGAIAFFKTFRSALDQFTQVLGGQLEKDLKTGGAAVDIWTD